MYYFLTASSDSYITENEPTYISQFKDTTTKNYGGDEILELKKGFFNSYDTGSFNILRISPTSLLKYKYYLKLYEVEGQTQLNDSYTIKVFPLSQSFEEGVGKKFDNPQIEKGVTWTDFNSGSAWSKIAGINVDSGSRIKSLGGGVWITGSGYEASQSFLNISSDIDVDVSDIVIKHLGGTNQIDNNGFILKLTDSIESDSTPHNLKFFSKQTNTIYQPRLEVRWNDVTTTFPSYTVKNYLTMSGEFEKVRFRIGCRKEFVQKTFTESVLTSSFYIAKGSGSYSIVDVGTNTSIVPFSSYTSMSADTTSMYFDQWFENFEPGRYYKILFKLRYNDGHETIIDNNEEFKIV